MKLDAIMEQYTTAKTRVEVAIAAVNAAKKKMEDHEKGLRAAAKELDECEAVAKAVRINLAAIAKKIGPVLHAEVSGICGADAKLEPPADNAG